MRVLRSCWTAVRTLTALSLCYSSLAQQSQSINVALRTSFDAAPYLVELLETAALENSTSYFPLLDRIAEGVFSDLSTDQEFYQKFLNVLQEDGHISAPDSLSSFKYALALRTAAPRIEAHFQYYRNSVEPKMMAAQDAACPVWVLMDGQQYCSPTLERAQQPVDIDDEDLELPFDRILGQSPDGVPSVLYADITHPLFGQFHETISRTALEGRTTYKLRHRPSTGSVHRPLHVSGYGAELVLKRTDYIVIDDRDAEKKAEDKKDEDQNDRNKPDFKPLTTSELSSLGLKAASFILSKKNPLDTLLDVSAHFPAYSAEIANHNTSLEFVAEHMANRDILLPPGYNVIWMNGLQLGKRQIDPHLLREALQRERRLIGQLRDIGLTPKEAIDLLSYETLAQAQADDEPVRYHWVDNEESARVIVWMNKLEEDKRYAGWPKSLEMVLQRVYPGQLPQIRRDIHNLIVPIDIGNIQDLDLVVNALQALVKRSVPLQIGLVPLGVSATATEAAKLSYYILDTYGISGLMNFYQNVVQSKNGLAGLQGSFETAVKDREARKGKLVLDFSEVLISDYADRQISALKDYQQRLGLDETTVLINGVAVPRDETWFEEVSQRLSTDLRRIQLGVYQSQIPEDTWVPGIFLEGAVHRRSKLVIPNDLKSISVSAVADLVSDYPESFAKLPRVSGTEASLLSDRVHMLVAADFDTTEGQSLVQETLKFHSKHPEIELLFAHTSRKSREVSQIAARLFAATLETDDTLAKIDAIFNGNNKDNDWEAVHDDAVSFWTQQEEFVRQSGLHIGKCGLWLNGRTVGPIEEPFLEHDFEVLLDFERKHRITPVTTAITGLGLEAKFQKPLDFAKITSIVARSLKSDIPEGMHESAPPIRMNQFNQWKDEHSMINVISETETTIQIVAVVDPASEVTQPWIPILKTLSELEGVDVKIYLNPQNKLEELPVKRFYSAVLNSAPVFDADGLLVSPRASFADVPQKTLFNLGMIVPPAWLVAPKESIYDLDNIKLSSVPDGGDVDAVYELEHILIEGHARDLTKGTPPRGAQLLLGTHENPHFADTIVMANLGYFQFKANPGYWDITLKPGRSSKIFNIDSIGPKGYAPQPGDETTSVALLSFQGVTLYPRLSRKIGMEDEDVLETSAKTAAMDYIGKGASFAQSALSSLGLKKSGATKNADINIFSVASGHLYERMLNIMMVSVMKNTKHTVKFWFIEQFLSPSFKISLPTLAEHYGFDFEMVTYKWPHWLRGQKEKQREIWGYKILFLDVLFPLNLDKVIFVDADQIVRTDMMNLNKIDLNGAPYGFTPMCDSRTEMEGYRFWKQGYWKNFLNGKPYHISALYVVDLKKFRELAAGDRLRGQYHTLSADPASLSNLDQDLPNHMQHVLPIHSLSQEWLWCETWCSDESLGVAKTIDLCNNPETKEPKLDRARRQVPEWTEYDDEIAGVLKTAKQSRTGYADVQEQEQKSAAREAEKEASSATSIAHNQHKRDEL